MKNAEKTIRYYNRLSGKYDSAYSAYLKHTHQLLLNHLEITKGDYILDVSCGTGVLAEMIAGSGMDYGKLVLNEPSQGMLDKAKEKVDGIDGIGFTQYFAEELPFTENIFDCLICLNSFHYYVNQEKVLKHFSRMLKPGGQLLILDWNLEGWFHIPNLIIRTLSPENINTRSLAWQMESLPKFNFEIDYSDKWNYRFWKFYLIRAKCL